MGFSFVFSVALIPFMLQLLDLLITDFAVCGRRPALAGAQGLDPKALLMPAALFYFFAALAFFFFSLLPHSPQPVSAPYYLSH